MSKEIPSTICSVPWLNVSLDVNGSMRPCCKFEQPYHSDRKLGFLNNENLGELWNSEAMIQLRKDFLDGKKPKECASCWAEEAAGIKSLRQEFTNGRLENPEVDYENLTPEAPKTLDLKLSNACNQKCRICGPVASSLFLRENLSHDLDWAEGGQTNFLAANKDRFLANKITEQPMNLETFKKWIPHLEHVELFGGEPLLIKENREIEKMLVDAGVAERISLIYNTNASIFKEDMVESWRRFKKVQICLSVDDIGERQEYERFPTKWETIRSNVLSYLEANQGNIEVYLFCTVSNFNVFYLPEFVEWACAEAPRLFLRFNLVHNDPEFCIANLPEGIKAQVKKKILNSLESLDISRNREPQEVLEGLKSVLSFMDSRAPDLELWKKFREKTARYDLMRGQKFQEVFPEFYGVILFDRMDQTMSPVQT